MLKRYHHIVGGMFRIVDTCVIGSVWLAIILAALLLSAHRGHQGLSQIPNLRRALPARDDPLGLGLLVDAGLPIAPHASAHSRGAPAPQGPLRGDALFHRADLHVQRVQVLARRDALLRRARAASCWSFSVSRFATACGPSVAAGSICAMSWPWAKGRRSST